MITPSDNSHLLACWRAALASKAMPAPPSSLSVAPFLRAAARHGVLALLGPSVVPVEQREGAVAACERAASMARRGTRALEEVSACLRAAHLPFLALKGPVTALRYYPAPETRSFGDVDILVRRCDLRSCRAELTRTLYAFRGHRLSRVLTRMLHFHESFEPHQAMRLRLEVHRHLIEQANLYRIAEAPLFERASSLLVGQQEVPVLSLEDDLLYLCIHAAKHGLYNAAALARDEPAEWFADLETGNRLRWFTDIRFLLQRFGGALDWALVMERAEAWNVREDVAVALQVLDRLAPADPVTRALEVVGRASVPASAARAGSGRTRCGATEWKAAAFRPVRLLLFLNVLFPRPADLQRYYGLGPGRRLLLRYLVHPFHMVAKQFR